MMITLIILQKSKLPLKPQPIIHTKRSGVFSSLILTHVPRLCCLNLQKPLHLQIMLYWLISTQHSETDNLGISSRNLQEEIEKLGTPCEYFPTFDEIENFLLENCTQGDLLITMGAGDVVNIGEQLLGK